jgi:hypothetical protein
MPCEISWTRGCAAAASGQLDERPQKQAASEHNGKAECFIQTWLRGWPYVFAHPISVHRARALFGWVRWYTRRKPHGSLGGLPPVSRVSHLCGQYT